MFLKRAVSVLVAAAILAGCVSNSSRSYGTPPSFDEGLAAIKRKDFPAASFHFAELAKDGDPSSMNNLGVSLLMVNRRDEAVYWFKKAARYGNPNASDNLRKMGESTPAADLVGQHPSQVNQKATEEFVSVVVLGILVGVSSYYAGRGAASHASQRVALPSKEARRSTSPAETRASSDPVPSTPLVERDIELTNRQTMEKYKGTVDRFGDATVKPAYGGATTYKGTLDPDGSGTLRSSSGDEIRVRQ